MGGKSYWYWKPSQLPELSEVMVLRGEPTVATSLNQHISYLYSSALIVYPCSHRDRDM